MMIPLRFPVARLLACTFAAAGALLALVVPSVRAQNVAVVGDSNQFGTLNLSTRTYTQITGSVGGDVSQITALAYNGTNFYIFDRRSDGSGTNLRTLSFSGVAGASLGTIRVNGNPDEYIGLAYRSASNTFLTTDFSNGYLASINPATAAGTQLPSSTGFGTNGPLSGKMAFVGLNLYETVSTDGSSPNGLYSLNPITGASTFLGNGGQATLYTDMIAFGSGSLLYGINGRTLFQINTGNGALTNLGAITGSNLPVNFVGAVVPEPGSPGLVAVAAAGLGLAGLMAQARRRTGQTAAALAGASGGYQART